MRTTKKDPTKTLTLRNRATREIDARFNRISRAIRSAFTVGNLKTNVRLARSGEFEFTRDIELVPQFERFLQEQIDEEILRVESLSTIERAREDHWLNRHVGEGYRRGAVKTRLAAERALPSLLALPDFNPFANPAHLDRAALIFQRTFTDLEGVTKTMSTQMSRILSEGIVQGRSPRDVARDLVGRVDNIGKTRAKLIARTEIIESHNSASIVEAENLERDTGVEIKMLWTTALDGRQRHSHEARHNKIFSRERAQELIGEPNCRCSIGAHFDI